MTNWNLAAAAIILAPAALLLMRGYYASQRVRHFRKKAGRSFINNPVRRYI